MLILRITSHLRHELCHSFLAWENSPASSAAAIKIVNTLQRAFGHSHSVAQGSIFIGISRDSSLSHRGPVSLHAPNHAHSPLSRDVTVATRPPSREHRGPTTAAVTGPVGKHPQTRVSSQAVPPLLGAGHCPGDLAQTLQVPEKEAKLRMERDLQQPFENSPQVAPTE